MIENDECGLEVITDLSKGLGGRSVVAKRAFKEYDFICEYKGNGRLLSGKSTFIYGTLSTSKTPPDNGIWVGQTSARF